MTVPYYPWTVWIWAALDPVLIAIAVYLGWHASQFGKVFIAAIAALALSVILSWGITALGIPWPAPVSRDGPTFFPVRTLGALLWAILAFSARRAAGRRA